VPFTDQQQQLLEDLFRAGGVLVGAQVRARFGLNTPIYFNLREPLHARPDLLWRVGREFTAKIRELAGPQAGPQCVVGVPDTATPLAVATALYASQRKAAPDIACGLLRKEAKTYPGSLPTNRMRWIGPKDASYEYNLIDDVVASGATKRSAAAAMRQEGITLRRIVVLFDRQQGDGLRREGFELYGIFAAGEAVDYYLSRGLISSSDHSRITEFLSTRRFDLVPK
jgi:orotate phosphoribosyltransferase